jgi:hypothetical protein
LKNRYSLLVIRYSFKPATGNRQLATGSWKLGTGNRQHFFFAPLASWREVHFSALRAGFAPLSYMRWLAGRIFE